MFGSHVKASRTLALVLCVMAAMTAVALETSASDQAYAVGYTSMTTTDPMGGPMPYSLWYPTEVTEGIVRLGPFELPGTWDAEPAPGQFGLVVLSHGSGGSDLGHWDTAVALARAGFIAAAPLHPRNNYRHDIGDDARVVLDGRPLQLSAVIDALLGDETWSDRIDPQKIGAFGFSAGGYTVLAALGAQPDHVRSLDHCSRHADDDPYCRIINGPGKAERLATYGDPVPSLVDGRLRAAVIADAFAAPFSDETLLNLPPVALLFFRPEHENVLNAAFHNDRVVHVVRQRDDFPEPQEIVVANANHYAFIVPLPDSVARNVPRIASDPEGFDRAAFHEEMNRTIVAFFNQALSD